MSNRFPKVNSFARLKISQIPLPDCQNDFISLHLVPGEDFAAAAAIGADWWDRKSLTFISGLLFNNGRKKASRHFTGGLAVNLVIMKDKELFEDYHLLF